MSSCFLSMSKNLSENQIKEAPESDYMNEEQLAFFKNRLVELYDSTTERIQEAKDQILMPSDSSDINDRASWEEQASLALRILEREQKLLPKIR